MRKGFVLSAMILSATFAMRCKDAPRDDDDDSGGESGESGQSSGGTSGKGGGSGAGRPGTGGTSTGGSGGSAGTGSPSGGTVGTTGGTGGTNGGTGGTNGGSGGTNGGTGGSGNEGGSGDEGGTGAEPGSGGTGTGGAGGTPGSGGRATGGTGGGGTGGTGGAGAGSGGTAGMSCGVGEGLTLVIEPGEEPGSGWIEGDKNCVGIEGSIYLKHDLEGSTSTLESVDGKICVSGKAEQVVGEDFANYWGSNIYIQLNNNGSGVAQPYNFNTYGVDGAAFTLTGEAIPDEIRPTFLTAEAGTQYCKRICNDGEQSILGAQAHADCWDGTTGATPSSTQIRYLMFSIPSVETGDVNFDFCIEGLRAIVDNANVGEPGSCPTSGAGGTGGTGGMGGTGGSGGSGAGAGGTGGAPGLSCVGRCGVYVEDATCQCDEYCTDPEVGDCCEDYYTECGL